MGKVKSMLMDQQEYYDDYTFDWYESLRDYEEQCYEESLIKDGKMPYKMTFVEEQGYNQYMKEGNKYELFRQCTRVQEEDK